MPWDDLSPAAQSGPGTVPDRSGMEVTSVEVSGALSHARFPALCARCGAPPGGTLRITKLFYRAPRRHGSSGSHRNYVTGEVDVPFCARCIEAHSHEARPIPEEIRRRLLRGWALGTLPYLVPLAVIVWFLLFVTGPDVPKALAPGVALQERLVWTVPTAFFALMALYFVWLMRRLGHLLHASMPHLENHSYALDERGPWGSRLVVPAMPTSILRSVDFEDDPREIFAGERHRFSFENREVAVGFAVLNENRVWSPTGARARLARGLQWAAVTAIVVAVVYQLLR